MMQPMSRTQGTQEAFAQAVPSIVPPAIMFWLAPSVQAQSFDAAVSLKALPDWMQIPGALIRPDCVHQVPNGV